MTTTTPRLTPVQRELLAAIAERDATADPYPFGGHNLRTVRVLAAHGYLVETTVPAKWADWTPVPHFYLLTEAGAQAYDALPERYRRIWEWVTARAQLAEDAAAAESGYDDVENPAGTPEPEDQGDNDQPTGPVSPHSLHNLIGWDLRMHDGRWFTIREVEHCAHPFPDTHVLFVGADPERYVFGDANVTVRPPRSAVALTCGHVGFPATNPERDEARGFCWLGCFRHVEVVAPVRPSRVYGAGERVELTVGHDPHPGCTGGTCPGTVIRTFASKGWRPGDMLSMRSARGGRWYEVVLDATGDTVTAVWRQVGPTNVPGTYTAYPVVVEVEAQLDPGRPTRSEWAHLHAALTAAGGYDHRHLDELAELIADGSADEHDRPVRVTVQVLTDVTRYAVAYAIPAATQRAA